MALNLVSQPEFTIDMPGFEDLVFTASSKGPLTLPEAVTFARERNSILQSAREALAFRIAAQGTEDANRYQATRTAALYFKDAKACYVAFDSDPAENILLARARAGYDAHRTSGRWLVPKSDPLIAGALKRAAKADRIVPLPLENTVRLATAARTGTSEYESSKLVRATIGDIAPAYAAFLCQQGFSRAYEWVLTPTDLDNIGVRDHVEVRRVGVGGGGCNDVYLYAVDRCYDCGRARGVRKISTGNKGGQ